jgi:hypothetical protein
MRRNPDEAPPGLAGLRRITAGIVRRAAALRPPEHHRGVIDLIEPADDLRPAVGVPADRPRTRTTAVITVATTIRPSRRRHAQSFLPPRNAVFLNDFPQELQGQRRSEDYEQTHGVCVSEGCDERCTFD